jgi:hypothetical protein
MPRNTYFFEKSEMQHRLWCGRKGYKLIKILLSPELKEALGGTHYFF